MKEISIENLLKINTNTIQIIDIRENYEYENGHINSINIPMDEILQSTHKIDKNKEVIIYCQTGRRAAAVVYMLHKYHNINNVSNLIGGYTSYLEMKLKNDKN